MKSEFPDFTRNVHSLLGLPFDALTLEQAVTRIRASVAQRTPCFLSTPNLNFLIAAQANSAFRNSVVRSDLSLADGMPIVWLSSLMGIPITERVAGSDVFEALRHSTGPLVRVYFFGGPPGVAERAARQINAEGKSMVCVGFESPGYGSIQDMSHVSTIANINASGADFLVVALGASKGQAWIEHNLAALEVPVVSHLGAVVNFVAGGVKRAPRWMQKAGLEWVWRIREEPALWKRYWSDGTGLIRLMTTSVVPFLFYKYFRSEKPLRVIDATIEIDNLEDICLRFQGENALESGEVIKGHLARAGHGCRKLTVKLFEVSRIPSDLLGTLQMIQTHEQITLRILVDNVKPGALQQLSLVGCHYESGHI